MNDSTLDIKAFLDKDEQKDLLRLLTAGSSTARNYMRTSWTHWNATASAWEMPATTLTTPFCWTA